MLEILLTDAKEGFEMTVSPPKVLLEMIKVIRWSQ